MVLYNPEETKMTNYKLKLFLCSILGIFIFIGCSTQNNKTSSNESLQGKLWYEINSLDQLIGKWEGIRNVRIPKNEENFMPDSEIDVRMSIEYVKDAEKLIFSMEIDMNRFLTDCMDMDSIKEAGFSKDYLWESIIATFEKMDDFSVGGKYFVNYNIFFDAEEILLKDSDEDFVINADGNTIRMTFSEAVSFGLGDEGFTEIILNKK